MIVHARSEHPRGAAAVRRLRQRARRYLAALGCDGAELSLLVLGDPAMRRLNRSWRGKDRPTDVLSFPAAGPGALLGDIVFSLDTARRAAMEEGRTIRRRARPLSRPRPPSPPRSRPRAPGRCAAHGGGGGRARWRGDGAGGFISLCPRVEVGVGVGVFSSLSPAGERAGVRGTSRSRSRSSR